jgi:hypothetical protein
MRSAREILNDAVQNITDDEVIKKGELQIWSLEVSSFPRNSSSQL